MYAVWGASTYLEFKHHNTLIVSRFVKPTSLKEGKKYVNLNKKNKKKRIHSMIDLNIN